MKKIFGAILALGAIGAVNAQQTIEGATFTTDGNVGINRPAPQARLDIYQDKDNKWTAILKNGAGQGNGLFIQNAAATNNPSLLIQDNYGKDRFKVQSNGLIGIGTSTPTELLDVRGNNPAIRVKSDDATKNATLKLEWEPNLGHHIAYHPNTAVTYFDSKYVATNGQPYGDVRFRRNVAGTMTNTLTIKGENGRVGIGTITPNAELDVNGIIQAGAKAATDGGMLLAHKYSGNDYIGSISSNRWSGSLVLGYGAAGKPDVGQNDELVSTMDNTSAFRGAVRVGPGTMEFVSTESSVQTAVGSDLTVKSRFYVKNNGDIGIGTKTPNTKLDVNGIIQAGENPSVEGGMFLAPKYAGQNFTGSLSSQRLNGAIVMGYGAAGKEGATASENDLVSTMDNVSAFRGALRVGPGTLEFLGTDASVQTAKGSNLTVKSRLFVKNDGNIGIGTKNPGNQLTVVGTGIAINDNEADLPFRLWSGGSTTSNHLRIGTDVGHFGDAALEIYQNEAGGTSAQNPGKVVVNGNLGIGTTDTKGFELGVNGKIAAEEVKVAKYANWPDFVFYNDYKLASLSEVEQHIKEKGHLKDIPSAKEVSENGFFLAQMDTKLLQKIEELTLYTIEQEKNINKLKEENKQLKDLNTKLIELQSRIDALENK